MVIRATLVGTSVFLGLSWRPNVLSLNSDRNKLPSTTQSLLFSDYLTGKSGYEMVSTPQGQEVTFCAVSAQLLLNRQEFVPAVCRLSARIHTNIKTPPAQRVGWVSHESEVEA